MLTYRGLHPQEKLSLILQVSKGEPLLYRDIPRVLAEGNKPPFRSRNSFEGLCPLNSMLWLESVPRSHR